MVIIGHFVPVVKNSGFAIGGMAISLVAGVFYAKLIETGWGDSLVGGILAGGACALVGIAVSVLLKDVPVAVLGFGTVASAITGLAGSALGRLFR
jgi:hypothetical protein